jgi:TonB family protein
MRAKVQGSVELEVVVGAGGAVERARVVGGALVAGQEHIEALRQQALKAVREWRFEPSALDGKPVEVRMRVVMEFRIY